MTRDGVDGLAREIGVRVRALASAVKAGRVEGVDAQIALDLGKVATAAERFVDKWQGYLGRELDEAEARQQRHDLRTPISHMMGYLELAEESLSDGLDDRGGVELSAWVREVQRLRGRVDEMHAALEASMRSRALRPRSRPNSRPSAARPSSGRLLVVDDDAQNLELLRRHLERQGYAVRSADGGEAALSAAREAAPDLILLDVVMPGLDGYETLRRLKTDERLCRVPVIMLSGLDHADTVVRCLEAGADDHVPKPVEPAILGARVNSSLDRKRLHDREREHLAALVAAKRRADAFIDYVVPMGARLASQTDGQTLLVDIVAAAQRFTGADGAVLYLRRESGELEAVVCSIRSLELERVGEAARAILPPTELAVQVASTRGTEQVDDVDACERFTHAARRSFDRAHGYRSVSVLALPLADASEVVRGVLELFNPTDTATSDAVSSAVGGPPEGVVAFDPGRRGALESLGKLAAVALARAEHERRLRERIAALEVEVDHAARAREVATITESDYFKTLREKARQMRARADADVEAEPVAGSRALAK